MFVSLEKALSADSALRALARDLLSDHHLAEDVLQDVAVSGLREARDPRSWSAYLKRAVQNRALNLRRSRARAARHAQLAAVEPVVPSVEQMAEREEVRQRVAQGVLALSEPHRTTVWLRFFEDLPPRKIAKRMGVPVNTVRTRVRRALDELRERLDGAYDGNRSAWCVLLVPMAHRSAIAAVSGLLALSGTLLMKKSIVVAAALLIVGGLGIWQFVLPSGFDPAPAPREQSASTVAGGVITTAAEDLERTELTPAAAEQPASVAAPGPTGSLQSLHGEPAAGVEYWVWDAQRPGWTRSRSVASYSPGERILGAPHGRTDLRGRWLVPGRMDAPVAASFRISDHVIVSFEVSLERAGGTDLVLPGIGEIRTWLDGAGPEDEWTVLYTPAVAEVKDNEVTHECAVHMVYPVQTRSGGATVSVVQSESAGTGSDTVTLMGVTGLPYQLVVEGASFSVDPQYSHVSAPVTTQHRITERGASLEIELVDAAGSLVVMGGLASCSRADGRNGDSQKLVDGHARLTHAFETNTRCRVILLTGDGEFFERDFTPNGARRTAMRFRLGEGRKPIHLALGRKVDVQQIAMIVLDGPAGPVFAGMTDWLLRFNRGAAFHRVDAVTLWLQDRGLAWLSGHVVLRDGSVARLHRPQPRPEVGVQVEWLPTVELEPVALGELERAERGMFAFRLAIPRSGGEPLWVTLQSFQYDGQTSPWPTWKLVAPRGYGRELRHHRLDQPELVLDLPAVR